MQVPNTSLSKSNSLSDLAFDKLLALADVAWAHSNAFLPGDDEGMTDQYPSILTSKSYCMDDTLTNPTNELLSHCHLSSLEQYSIIHEHDNPQGISCTTCCSISTSQVAPPIPDNGTGAGKKPAEAMQVNMEEKDQGGKMINASAIMIDNNGTSLSKEAQPKRTQNPVSPKPAESNNDQTEKRMCARRKISPAVVTVVESTKNMIPKSAKSCCNRYLNFDKGASNESCADKENVTVHPGIEIGIVAPEMNADIACELNSSMKQASNYTSFPNDKQAPGTSSKSNLPGEKPKVILAAKRKFVRRKGLNTNSTPPTEMTEEFTEELPEYAKISCKRSLNPDIGARDESYARRKEMKTSVPPTEVTGELTTEKRPEFDKGAIEECSVVRENATIHLSKETIVTQEMNPDLVYDVNSSMKQASQSYMSLTEYTHATNTSSRRNPHGAKPKESSTSEREYVRRSALNKSSTPTEVLGDLTGEMMLESAKTSCRRSLNFDKGARDESSADRENATVHLCKEIGLVMQEMDVGFAYDINTSVKQAAANNYMSFPNEQTPSTSPSKNNPLGAKPKENLAGKQEFDEMSRRRSSNSDIGIKDESSACREISAVQIANVVEETPVSLAYNQGTWLEQALNSYMSLPEDTQSPSTYPSKSNLPGAKPKERPTGKRKYVRKKKSNSTATPTEMTGELTEPIMSDSSTIISWGMSLNFDKGGIDESNTCRESLACDQNTLVKEALYNYMSLSENTHVPSTSLPQSNPPGAKLNANPVENKSKRKGLATAQDGNISNSQISTTGLQMVGYERKHSRTIKCAYNSSMNLVGTCYNGLPSYESKFRIQFPNIQKKRRSEMRKTSNTHITSFVASKKEVPLTCTQKVAQAHPYASKSNCWMYGGSAYNSAIHNAQTFDEFILTLRRLTDSSQPPAQTHDCNSLTRIRNSDVEPNYNAKQLGISNLQTFGDADTPQTCIDVLAKEMHASCAKKKRSRRRALSSSAHSNTNETQQHHNFAWGNHHLPLGKSSGIARQVIWKSVHNVEALAEQFRQLNINTEARDLVLHVQNALVPFQGSFDPIKKQRPRPKVYLDEKADEVWKLLMLDINHHGIDGTDEDKAKWWQEERNVFRGRADSFIARMHLVQGDRRFSRWIGSVLNSVVGVLTQDVSDHLSSSALMSLAARFPKKSSSMCETYHGKGTSLVVNNQVHIVEPEENTEWDVKLLNLSVYDQSSMTVDLVEHSGEKAVYSDDSCIITTSVISLTDESNSRLSGSPQRNIMERQCPMVMIEEGEEKSCHDGARKELNGIISSQCSIISSQLSGDFSNDQNPEKTGSCSDSNSGVEDQSSRPVLQSTTVALPSASFLKW